jgi:hypothetical protein
MNADPPPENSRRTDGSHGGLALVGIFFGLLLACVGGGMMTGDDRRNMANVVSNLEMLRSRLFPHSNFLQSSLWHMYGWVYGGHMEEAGVCIVFAGALALVLSMLSWFRKNIGEEE